METIVENGRTYGGLRYFLHGDVRGDGRFVDTNLWRLLTLFQSMETVVETVNLDGKTVTIGSNRTPPRKLHRLAR